MKIQSAARWMRLVNGSSRSVLAVAFVAVAFVFRLLPACSSKVLIGHGGTVEGAGIGLGGELGAAAGGGEPAGDPTPNGDATAAGGSTGIEQAGAGGAAGSEDAPCTGSLDAVNQAWGPVCPASLCEATAWAAASCSASPGLVSVDMVYCTLRALNLDLGDGASKTCLYAATIMGGEVSGPYDGPLVGVTATAVDNRFCDDTASAISAGQAAPADCRMGEPTRLCDQASSSGGALLSDGGAPTPAVQACFDNFDHICKPCCPALPPDCESEPAAYPGYRCSVSSGSFCSCQCSGSTWLCAC